MTAARARTKGEAKRELILDAARAVFEEEGLDGASLRAIATRAGYTPAALYFHFDSKEALYATVLEGSIARLAAAVEAAVAPESTDAARLCAAALAFFDFYLANPRDLDLGFYLFRGGMQPKGLGRERDKALNTALAQALKPIADAAAGLGADEAGARLVTADVFAHATGLLLLAHTGRIRMFAASARGLMEDYLALKISALEEKRP